MAEVATAVKSPWADASAVKVIGADPATPPAALLGGDCLCCYDAITAESYCGYQCATSAGSPWYFANYCASCVGTLRTNQWPDYQKQFEKADCVTALKRVIAAGIPLNFHDVHGAPVPESLAAGYDTRSGTRRLGEVATLYFAGTGVVPAAAPGTPGTPAAWAECVADLAERVRLLEIAEGSSFTAPGAADKAAAH